MESQSALPLPVYQQNKGCVTPAALFGIGFLLLLLYDGGTIFVDFLNPMFFSHSLTLGTILAAAIFGGAVLRWGSGGPAVKAILGGGIVGVVVFPLLLPLLYKPYAPYAAPAPGYTMQWITQPANAWTSAFKSAQRVHDTQGCTYTLHGWTSDNVLYYRSSCQRGLWRYNPINDAEPQWLSSVPEGIDIATPVDRGTHFENGGINYPDSRAFALDITRRSFIIYEVAKSIDGQWIAAAIMNYYGPHDVVILSAAGD